LVTIILKGEKTMRLIPYIRKTEVPARIWPETSFFDDFFDSFLSTAPAVGRGNWVPNVDILEKDGNLVLHVEVPGISEKDLELKLEGHILTLKGEKKLEKDEDRKNFRRRESFHGTFSRAFTLPETSALDKVNADYRNGVLTITVPQKEEARPREIPVKVN
jgi:HSP20 family protein